MTNHRLIAVIPAALLLGLSAASLMAGYDEGSLARSLEGRTVTLRVSMPGDVSGVDVYPEYAHGVDYPKLGERLKRYGVAIPAGGRAMITNVRIRTKEIEIHLDGGGWGGFFDGLSGAGVVVAPNAAKTSREKELDKAIDRETDPAKKDRLKKERRDLRIERQRDDNRLALEAQQTEVLAKQAEREQRAVGGSRFNLKFDGPVPPEFVSPEAVVAALSGLADFGDSVPNRSISERPRGPLGLRKGLSEAQVRDLLGPPVMRRAGQAPDPSIVDSTYELADSIVTARFADDTLIRYSIGSR